MDIRVRKAVAIIVYLTYYNVCLLIIAPSMYSDIIVLMLLILDMFTYTADTLIRPFAEREEADWSSKLVGLLFLLHPFLLIIMFNERLLLTSVYFVSLDLLFVSFIGLIIYIIGSIVAIVSRIQLGRYGHGMIAIEENHELLTSGLYNQIRHPLYTGGLLGRIGIGLTLRGYVTGFLHFLFYFIVFRARMNIEEGLLLTEFGEEYEEYMQRTKRLIPYIY